MVHFPTPAERRDDDAADRDADAERRDRAAEDRDAVAEHRDTRADGGDRRVREDGRYLDDLVDEVSRQILDRFTRLENSIVDPAGWSHLTPAALAELRAHAAEQRRLAALDRDAVDGLLATLRAEIRHEWSDRAAAADRRAAALDRIASGQDRHDSVRDRDRAARDRDQSAIDRAQAAPTDHDRPESAYSPAELPADRVARAVTDSRRRIADSRARSTRSGEGPGPSTPDAPRG